MNVFPITHQASYHSSGSDSLPSQPDFRYDIPKKKKKNPTNPWLLPSPLCQFFCLLMKRKRRVYVSKVSKSKSESRQCEPKKKKDTQ